MQASALCWLGSNPRWRTMAGLSPRSYEASTRKCAGSFASWFATRSVIPTGASPSAWEGEAERRACPEQAKRAEGNLLFLDYGLAYPCRITHALPFVYLCVLSGFICF